MRVKRRCLPNFETCSVALFASLALYGPLPSRAQTAAPRTSPSLTTPVQGAIPPNRWTPEQLNDAFRRSDANHDGRLSRDEASTLGGLARQFDRVDSNKDGSISSAEFDEALK
ncbi:MAG TPA: EF-hand domain-containing protein [Ramlibacter sp.]|nr:EF-hand domain-containing protein [Ramlibacter sp.]